MQLPAEIRTKIFEIALSGNVIELDRSAGAFGLGVKVYSKTTGELTKAQPLLGLLTVCRQIYHKVATLVYYCNDFSFTTGNVLREWCQARKHAQINVVQTIVLNCYMVSSPTQLMLDTFAGGLRGLRTVKVWTIGMYGGTVSVMGEDPESIDYREELRLVQRAMDLILKVNPKSHIEVVYVQTLVDDCREK